MLNSNGNNIMFDSEVSCEHQGICVCIYIYMEGKTGCEQVNECVFNVDEIV
jgi:hypothetical protein